MALTPIFNMKKKRSLFSFKRKKSKKKTEEQTSSQDKKQNQLIIKIKQKYKKFVNYLKKLKKNHEDKIKAIKKFFLIISGYGLVINYALHFLLGMNFNLFTLFAWGIAYYFINDEFVEWFRRLIARR